MLLLFSVNCEDFGANDFINVPHFRRFKNKTQTISQNTSFICTWHAVCTSEANKQPQRMLCFGCSLRQISDRMSLTYLQKKKTKRKTNISKLINLHSINLWFWKGTSSQTYEHILDSWIIWYVNFAVYRKADELNGIQVDEWADDCLFRLFDLYVALASHTK